MSALFALSLAKIYQIGNGIFLYFQGMKSTSEKEALVAIGHRFQKYYSHRGYTRSQIAERMQVPAQYLSRINEGNNFNSELLVTIRQYCSDLNLQWLLTGKGDMLHSDSNSAPNTLMERHRVWEQRLDKACKQEHLHSDERKAAHVEMLLRLLQEVMMHRGEVLARHVDIQYAIMKFQLLVSQP